MDLTKKAGAKDVPPDNQVRPTLARVRRPVSRKSHPAHYRWVVLDKARIYVCTSAPPEDIQTRSKTVVQKETAKGRKEELAAIGKQLCHEFIAVMNVARREDDSIEPIHRALSSMDREQKLTLS